MKSLLATALMVVSLSVAAQAQTPASPAKPKASAPPPALQTPADTANAMAQSERTSIQSDLAWIGLYNGAINGEVNDRMVAAIKDYQKNRGAKVTGVLNPQERGDLNEAARKLRDNVGWKIVTEPVTGTTIGIPLKLVSKATSDANGAKWTSPTGTIQISLDRRKEAQATTASVASEEKKAFARRLDYSVVKPDFFVLQGLQGLKKFYIRGQTRNNEVRVLTILYDQATEGTMTPITIAMSSAFEGFPGSVNAQATGTPSRKAVEYSTGIVASADGAIVVDRQAVEACQTIVVSGFGNAARIADDEKRELALLRVYGASGLVPLAMGGAATPKSEVTITGIADPQAQGGRGAVTSLTGMVTGNGPDASLLPSMQPGFSGAAVTDADGKFAGLARIRPAVMAAASGSTLPGASAMTTADAVRDFLRANNVVPATSVSNPKTSVLRVICVRK